MKWWFSDYDGTINLHHNDQIEPNDLAFIKTWIKNGNKMVVTTGRVNHEITTVLTANEIPYDYLIANNGACVYDGTGQLIENVIIPLTVRDKVLRIMESQKNNFIMGYCLENVRHDLNYVPTTEVDNSPFLKKYSPRTSNWQVGADDILTNSHLNLLYFYFNAADAAKIVPLFSELTEVKIVRTHNNVLEVMDRRVSKAYGIDIVRKTNQIEIDDIYTSGDGENDIEMLQYTHHSFAMGTATQHVKSKAQYVIDQVCEIAEYVDNN